MTKSLTEIVEKCKKQERKPSICMPRYFHDDLECKYLEKQTHYDKSEYNFNKIHNFFICKKGDK